MKQHSVYMYEIHPNSISADFLTTSINGLLLLVGLQDSLDDLVWCSRYQILLEFDADQIVQNILDFKFFKFYSFVNLIQFTLQKIIVCPTIIYSFLPLHK